MPRNLAIVTVIFAGFLLFTAGADDEPQTDPIPVVLWHGMGDSSCNPLSMGAIKSLIEQHVPGVYVRSLMIGDNVFSDTEHGFFLNVNTQISEVCAKLANDSLLARGYNAVGFSQGGQFLRAVAQRCPNPPMKNLVSVGGQHQGVYGFPRCPAADWICDMVRRMLNYGAYVSFVQNTLVQAEYWHDPMAEDEYRHKSIFLADINNELHQNDDYKRNLLRLQNLALIMFTHDTMVVPKESEWFGFYQVNDVHTMLQMNQTALFIQDRIGLKELQNSGRLHFHAVDGDHLQISDQEFIAEVINKYLV